MNLFRKVIAMAAPTLAPVIELETADTDDHATADVTGSAEIKNRCIAIMESEESVGRRGLAQHLALNTDLPIADVLAALCACPRDTRTTGATSTPESAARTARIRQADEAFKLAFRGAEHSIPDASDDPVSTIARITKSYELATGARAKPQI
jgi:hypothetical protein